MMSENASALHLLLIADPALLAIIKLSLLVSLSATIIAGLIGAPFGALIALTGFPGREVVIVILNALMGLTPVVVGLSTYLLLSRSGPLGSWGLLFTPTAMVIAQRVLVTPIIALSPARPSKTCGSSIKRSSPRWTYVRYAGCWPSS